MREFTGALHAKARHPLPSTTNLELWGGVECTISRVGDRYRDQSALAGHDARPEDLARFAALGITRLRCPVLWEAVAPERADLCNFAAADARLAELRRLGVAPIIGLIHHGSGPRYTSLLDPGFAAGLAQHARRTAQRYPWVQDWCPVNEPLTTARFSALYGHWSPHRRDEHSFLLALFHQIEAVRLAMREIRRVRPDARLIQTEDLGYIHASPAAREQAEFENHRRWLTWDLLAGRVGPEHPMFAWIEHHGFGDRARRLLDEPCPADVIGVNHYLSSERFLDERVEDHPPGVRGGNGRIAYADIEAVRMVETRGPEALLRESATRYSAPVAVTECHNACTREEQMRWFLEVWRAARRLRAEGVDVRAVTAWALLGAVDWASLLTREEDRREVGVFDIGGGRVRETAMGGLLRTLAHGREPDHPALDDPGWWRRPERLWRPSGAGALAPTGRPILITGKTGTLGRAFARACAARGLRAVFTDRATLDVTCAASIARLLAQVKPWAVINAAAYVRVDEAEEDEAACRKVNAEGAAALARACAAMGTRFVGFSSDLVFGGDLGRPYVETDLPGALNVYGRSKADAERRMLAENPAALVIRTAAFFSPHDPYNFAHAAVAAARAGQAFRAARDLFVTPTYVPHLVDTALDLLIDGESGLWHLSNHGRRSWADFACEAVACAGLDPACIEAVPAESLPWRAPRPIDVSLASERGLLMPSLEAALGQYADALRG